MDKFEARKLSRDARRALCGQIMRLRQELGLTWHEISRVMGLHVTNVFRWAQRYGVEGEAGLVSTKLRLAYLPGRTLTQPLEWVLRTMLTSQAPTTRGLPFSLWNRRAVRDLIEVEFGIDMQICTVGEYLKRWATRLSAPPARRWSKSPGTMCITGCRRSTL